MSLLGGLTGGLVTSAVEAVGGVVDELWTSEDEKLTRAEARIKLAQQPHLAQAAVNRVEAQHRSVFVAGWRPAIGWVCALALLYSFVLRDLLLWAIAVSGADIAVPPELAMEHLMTVLLGMLGLGGLRTVEKLKGRAK